MGEYFAGFSGRLALMTNMPVCPEVYSNRAPDLPNTS